MRLLLLLLLIILAPPVYGMGIGVSPPRIYLNSTDCSTGSSLVHIYNPNNRGVYFIVEYNSTYLNGDGGQGFMEGNEWRGIRFTTKGKIKGGRYTLPVIVRFSYDNFSADSSIGSGVVAELKHENGCSPSTLDKITGYAVSIRKHADEMSSAFFLCILGCGLMLVSLMLKERNERRMKTLQMKRRKQRKMGEKNVRKSSGYFE